MPFGAIASHSAEGTRGPVDTQMWGINELVVFKA
jgi:hypothetical protein